MCEFAEVEALAGWIEWAEEALEAFAEILRADEEGLGGFVLCVLLVELDEADGGARRESGEEIFVVRCVEVLAAVEVEHGVRILRRMGRPATFTPQRVAVCTNRALSMHVR